MKEYKLRYDGKGNFDYTEREAIKGNRNRTNKSTDEFGKRLEEMIKKLGEKFPGKSMNIEITTW